MVAPGYIPDVGDVVWLTLNPTEGHEQAGRRPALVLTPQQYNARTSLAVCCAITHAVKGYPFEVQLEADAGATGVILCDQVRSMDWIQRRAAFIGRVNSTTLDAVRMKLKTLLQISLQ